MTQEELNSIDKLLSNCRELERELNTQKEYVDFLLNEYKTNKKWFREEPGRVTIEDVIKTAFEFGWASKGNYDYDTRK